MAGRHRESPGFLSLLTIAALAAGHQPHSRGSTDSASAPFHPPPPSFERNEGQTNPDVLFSLRAPSTTLLLTQTHAAFVLGLPPRPAVARMHFVGANLESRVEGIDRLPGRANYFIGQDPTNWHTNVETFSKVRYEGLYPDIDLVFHGDHEQLEYDFIVAPGGDPAEIAVAFTGVDEVRIDGNGELVLESVGGEVRHRQPFIYQMIDGERRQIDGGYLLSEHSESPEVRFRIASYDRSRALVIDPVLIYSTYWGGSGADRSIGIEVDETGVYVFGQTASLDFPATVGSAQPRLGGGVDAFVSKLSLDGTTVLYSTYFGGSGNDDPFVASGFAIDAYGSAIVGSRTDSRDLPVVNAFQPTFGGGAFDGFIAKLSPSGSTLLYSSYIGGSDTDQLEIVAVDVDGHAYISGTTRSPDFPTLRAYQANFGGTADAFVAKVRIDGQLEFSTFLGGSGQDDFTAIGVDPRAGEAVVTGRTNSLDFPMVAPIQSRNAGGNFDMFVTRFARDGRSLLYSTYIGGSGGDQNRNILVNRDGETYLVGVTASSDFPTVRALQSSNAGGAFDAFIVKLPPDGSHLLYATYFGGSGDDRIVAVAEDRSGHLVFSGPTNSTNLPVVNPLQRTFAGGMFDAMLGHIGRRGEALMFSTYWGGSGEDRGGDVDVDARDHVYVTGFTDSADFPTLNAFQRRNAGGFDAWLVKIAP